MLDLLKKTRWLTIASMLALASTATVGCAADSTEEPGSSDDDTGSSTDDITQVSHTKVKRQSIGNCWLYANTSWLEALNKAATGVEKNTSESWLTYWHWYEQLANGSARTEISTGGSFGTGADLINRYGIMIEGDFIAGEADAEMSAKQSAALEAVNGQLKNGGPLKEAVAARNKIAIRKELDKAWGLTEEGSRRISKVFGEGVTRTLDKSATAVNAAAANKIIAAKNFPVQLKDPTTGQKVTATLQDAIGKSNGWYGPREGKFAWNEVNYPSDATGRRAFWKRVQKALHDGQPVITSWKVDFNALSSKSVFSFDELTRRGPGRQGGHMTVMHDYQAEVPGVGLLKAGEAATPEQMQKALADGTKIQFVRVKNSWGGIRPDRWNEAAIPGYHDLEMKYLDGPIKECSEKPDGSTDTANCTRSVTPLWDVVLPAGY